MRISTKIFIGFFLIILFSIIGFVVNFKLSTEVNTNMAFLNNSEAIIRNSAKLHKTIIEMQSSFRGFLLTGNENFLIPYFNGVHDVKGLYKEQRALLKSGSQLHKLDSILLLHNSWVDYANSLINARKRTMDSASVSPEYLNLFENKLQKQVGKFINDKINEIFREFDRYEYFVREERRSILNASIADTRNVSILLASVIIAIGIVSAFYITRIISKRILSMVHLADKISKGNFEVIDDTKNDELTDLSLSLNVMSARLNRSFSDLERKNKELDQFAYVVSHDLKAPLRGIYNVFNWLDEDHRGELSEQVQKYLEMMKGRTQRLENLITGLLDYARIGRLDDLPSEEVNTKVLLDEIIEMIVPPGVKVELRGQMPVFTAQKIRLQQVFTNLISNAVKYSGKSSPIVRITCKDKNDFYEFCVSDNGIGIAPEYHEKIFVIFQTLREKNEKESTGLGLAIVKKIIEDQKGYIKVRSNVGLGTSFIFSWPKEIVKEYV